MNKFRVKLQTSSVLNIPFKKYDQDFTFVVNGKQIKTSRIIADILSPKIAEMHLSDPTFDEMIIKTQSSGDFSNIFRLLNFEYNEIPICEASFLSEVIDILGNNSIEIFDENYEAEIKLDNIFERIVKHDHFPTYYSKYLKDDIDFISENFYNLKENDNIFQNLRISTLQQIFSNPKLQLRSEDQLINCINSIYTRNPKFSPLYQYVDFSNVTQTSIDRFLQLFNINDITNETWRALSQRLCQEVHKLEEKDLDDSNNRYKKIIGISIPYEENNEFKGIINYLREASNGNIEKEISSSSSSTFSKSYDPNNVLVYNDKNKRFLSEDNENSWICIDFKKHQIAPTNYTIKSFELNQNSAHPKSWVIEASNDNENWVVIDERNDCPLLNGRNFIHTFRIRDQVMKPYRYIRMRQTKPNWAESNYLMISCIEFYGVLL